MKRTLSKILVSAALVAGGCTCGEEAEPPAAETPAVAETPSATEDSLARVRAETAAVTQLVGRTVHFDLNRSRIRPGEDTQILDEKVAILQANPGLAIEITGHCDERGSNRYNMALGSRRAESARDYLTSNGIATSRITVRSRGEEEPVDAGHTEAAWSQNRRNEFRITAGGGELKRPAG